MVTAQEKFIDSLILRIEKQVEATQRRGNEIRQFVGFSKKQLSRREEKVRRANERRNEVEDLLFSKEISLKLLEEKVAESASIQEEFKRITAGVFDKIENAAPTIQRCDKSFAQHIDSAEKQAGVQLKLVADLENLVTEMNDLAQKEQEEKLRMQPKLTAAAMQTENVAFEEGRHRKSKDKVAFSDPPLVRPNKWKVGWEVPYELRRDMEHLKMHKRGLDQGALEALICEMFCKFFETKKRPQSKAASPTSASSSAMTFLTPTFGNQVFRFFQHRYKDALLRDWHLIELVNSLRHHRETSPVADVFGSFLGAFHEEPSDFSTALLHHSCCYEDPSTRVCNGCFSSTCFCFVAQFLAALDDFHAPKLKPSTTFHASRLAYQAAKMMDAWTLLDTDRLYTELNNAAELIEWKGKATFRIRFSQLLAVLTREFAMAERSTNRAIKSLFDEQATVRRFIFGTVISCDRENKTSETHDSSYFCYLDKNGLSQLLKEAGLKCNPKMVISAFSKAVKHQRRVHEDVSEVAWVESTALCEGLEGRRMFYVNQVTGERVWDDRPAGFTASPDIGTVQNLAEEVDLAAILWLCHEQKWFLSRSV